MLSFPSFDKNEVVTNLTDCKEVTILSVRTYNPSTDEYLGTPEYTIKALDGSYVKHNVSEKDLDYCDPQHED